MRKAPPLHIPADEADDWEVKEADYTEVLHPRNRLGQWRDVPDFTLGRLNVDAFRKAATAERWLKERYPDKTFDLGVGDYGKDLLPLPGPDMTVLGPALKQWVQLAEQYPWAKWDGIIYDRDQTNGQEWLSHNAVAGVRRDDMLLLGGSSWGDSEAMKEELEAAELAEWHPPGCSTPTALLTHEFAHVLDRSLREKSDVSWRQPYGSTYGRVDKTWADWVKNTDKLKVSGYAAQASMGGDEIFGGNETERVAEAFMSIHHTPPELQDEYTQRMGAVLADIADASKWKPLVNDDSIDFKGERTGGRPPLTKEDHFAWSQERLAWEAQRYGPLHTLDLPSLTLPQTGPAVPADPSPKSLYQRFYGDDYQEKVSALYERRHALTAELRAREAEKKKETAQRFLDRLKELEAQGLSGAEATARMEQEGWVRPNSYRDSWMYRPSARR